MAFGDGAVTFDRLSDVMAARGVSVAGSGWAAAPAARGAYESRGLVGFGLMDGVPCRGGVAIGGIFGVNGQALGGPVFSG